MRNRERIMRYLNVIIIFLVFSLFSGILSPVLAQEQAQEEQAEKKDEDLSELNLDRIADDIRYQNAYQFIKLERYDKALQMMGEYLEVYSEGIHRQDAFKHIAQIYFMRNQYNLALKYYLLLYEEFSESDEGLWAYYNIGICYNKMARTSDARKVFQRIVDEYPASLAARKAQMQLDLEEIMK